MESASSKQRRTYFVPQIRGRWLLLLLAPMTVLPLLSFPSILPQGWVLPLTFAFYGVVLPISAVQPWLRQTRSFWLSLPVVFGVDLLVGHRINVHLAPQSRGELKGTAFLELLTGYAVGVPVFLLLRRVIPTRTQKQLGIDRPSSSA